MSEQLDLEPVPERPHGVCRTFCAVPALLGVLGIACFATGALVPVGVVLLLIAIVLGAFAWIASLVEKRYDRTHHYDVTNEEPVR